MLLGCSTHTHLSFVNERAGRFKRGDAVMNDISKPSTQVTLRKQTHGFPSITPHIPVIGTGGYEVHGCV